MDIQTNHHTLVLSGDFDVRSTFEVRQAVNEQLATADDVVVDLSGVATIDLTALRVLAAASRRAHGQGQHLRLRGCRPAVRRMLHLSRLYRIFEVERTAQPA